MQKLLQKKIIANLEIVLKGIKRPSVSIPYNSIGRVFSTKRDGAFVLLDEVDKAFSVSLDAILEDEYYSNRFSKSYIDQKLQRFVGSNREEYMAGDFDITRKLREEIKEWDNSVGKFTVIIPIGGINFDRSRGLKIGNAVIKKCRKDDLPFKRHRKIPEINNFLIALEGQVVGAVEVEGEPIKAKEKAMIEISQVLNVLRLYVRLFHFSSSEIQIRIIPEIMTGAKHPVIINESKQKIVYSGGKPAGGMSYTINNENLKKMRKHSLRVINGLLTKKLSQFEREMLRAIKWYGNAVDMTDPVLKFLNYAIVLEVLLSKQQHDSDRSITDKLAEGAAFLWSKEYADRKKMKSMIKKLYDIRSAIVHRGKHLVEDKYIRQIEWIGLILILKLIKNQYKFDKKDDLLDWIDKKRLS